MGKIVVMDHPLIQHKIGIIRREETGSKDFRTLVSEIAMLMCYEATRDLKLADVEIDFTCRSWHGGWYAGNDSCSKSRTYRTLS